MFKLSLFTRRSLLAVGLILITALLSGPSWAAEARRQVEIVNAQQSSKQMAQDFFMQHQQEPFVHELPPAMQKQMQESLQRYVKGWLCKQFVCGDEDEDGTAGSCMQKTVATCPRGYELQTGMSDMCPGRPKGQCTGGSLICTNPETGKTKRITISCKWTSATTPK